MLGAKPQLLVPENPSAVAPWQQRVLTERAELADKIGKLAAFLASESFPALPTDEQTRLERQLSAMQTYRGILSERIAAWEPSEPAEDPGTVSA